MFTVTTKTGYLGALEATGSEYAKGPLYGSELSAAIRKALRENVPVARKSDISVRSHTASMCQEITVTVKLSRGKYARPYDDVRAALLSREIKPRWCYDRLDQADEDGEWARDITRWEFEEMDSEGQEAALASWLRWEYRQIEGERICEYNLNRNLLTGEACALLDSVQHVLNAFNHDGSNSVVDYFDRHFYDSIYIQWV